MTKFFNLLIGLVVLGSLFLLSSCNEEIIEPLPPNTISDPAFLTLTPNQTYISNNFERGETVSLSIEITANNGVEIFEVTQTVDDGSPTPINVDPRPTPGVTSFTTTYNFEVIEDTGSVVTLNFRLIDQQTGTVQDSASYTYDVVSQGNGGGGGVFPLLRAQATVSLGSQINPLGSYLATSLITSTINVNGNDLFGGVFTNDQAGMLMPAEQQEIDITMGVLDATGTTAGSERPALIAPDLRSPLNFNNPLGDNARTTLFVADSTLTSLDAITSSDVENNIDVSNGTGAIVIVEGQVYGFRNADGEKGYILVTAINGTGDDRSADLDILVQVAQ